MKILITGANGFIGSFLVEEALSHGFEVWAGVRKSSDLKYLNGLKYNTIDLRYSNLEELKAQITDFKTTYGEWDYIIHNAGLTKSDKYSEFIKVNTDYSVNFIKALIETGASPKRFIYMSSLSVYGSGDEKTLDPIMLSDKPKPNTWYARSKEYTEVFLSQQDIGIFPYVIIRPTGVYGPREKDYFLMIQTIQRGFEPSIGFKPQYLTFIYVKDLTKVVLLALEKDVVGKSYFVSDNKVYTNSEYSNIIKKALNVKCTIKIKVPLFIVKSIAYSLDNIYGWFGKSPTLNKDKYKIISACNWKCETGPLYKDLGFTPKYFLEDGIKESIDWYRKEGWLPSK